MDNKQLTIKKHSALIQISVKELTVTQRKIINSLIYIVQQTGNKEIYSTSLSTMKKMCMILSTENVDVKDQLRSLTHISIEFNYLNKDKKSAWEVMSLLAGARVIPGDNIVEFSFAPFLKEKILNPRIYAPLNIKLVAGMKSSYSIILYEFLRDYLSSPSVPIIKIKELRDILGICDDEYNDFYDFKKRVLNVAVNEINKKTDIQSEFKLLKEEGRGNKYSHIQFFASKKSENVNYEKDKIPGTEENALNLDLFEDTPGQVVKIPDEIMNEIPDRQRTEPVKETIFQFLEKGPEYIVSNIKYSLKKSKDNFPAYLRQALEQDYARHDREVKLKTEKKHKETNLQAEEKEKKVMKDKIELEAIKKILEELPKKKYDELEGQAKMALKLREPDNAFAVNKTSVMIEMANIYKKNHDQVSNYNDQDFK